MQQKTNISNIVLRQVVEHADRSSDWQECCQEILVAHNLDVATVRAEMLRISIDRMTALIVYCIVSYGMPALVFVMAPGFLMPFYNHPVGRIVILVCVLWSFLGLILLLRSKRQWQHVLEIILFGMPLTVSPMLGPAVVTLLQFLGAVF